MKDLVIPCIVILCSLYANVCGQDVQKCYSCPGTCNQPLDEIECSGTDNICLSLELTLEDATSFELRNCFKSNDSIISTCEAMNEDDLSWCYTCNTSLCNDVDWTSGVKQCYACNDTCNTLQLEECPTEDGSEYVCMSRTTTENTTTTIKKGCAKATELENCENIDNAENSTCYSCKKDFCNKKNEVENLLAKKCYYCQYACNHPLDQEECPNSNAKDYVCKASKTIKNGTTIEFRGCVPNSDFEIESCDNTNLATDSSCYVCDTDLCNNKIDDDDGKDNNSSRIYLVSIYFVGLTILLEAF